VEEKNSKIRIQSLAHLFSIISPSERIITDFLRTIILQNLAPYCKEKISFNVPYFYGNRGICIIWPATIPRGGIKTGVLLGFWNGRLLADKNNYLTQGTNKKVYYRIFNDVEEIDPAAISILLKEAILLDSKFKG
jgi:hypothetical protein